MVKFNNPKEDLDEAETDQQMKDIEELVRAPQIMEKAIADGGIDPKQLQRLLATRDRVQQNIDKLEQHILLIMSIHGA